ncbi:lysine biosynthesis protein LysW [Candidatus Shapirobacteria bacterium CG09_land_8_20_14_0_10_39_12]|uniref:Lysine biosynthesis protein LysW n=1 Tax=Candidatus Shapirobacteria bacterium CG09_land_8_20_14_0_10_39_12 TaxID=1974885 RepID=A0A2H0WPF6_9BACT|nr:MAG: lysine biosynthesis protein LysW [Candidatus Shapirobacteria bacterium CG09_land_8_20_14_0_10_39_12]
MSKTAKCPDPNCDPENPGLIIIPDDAVVGDILECQTCGAEVEIISVDPPQVVLLEEEK